jgi:hypothetical protein
MKNWEKKLREILGDFGKQDRTSEDFRKVDSEIIRPTFEKIKSVLHEYCGIDGELGLSYLTITISGSLFCKLEFEPKMNNEITVRTIYFDLLSNNKEVKKSEEKTILLNEITEEWVGHLFVKTIEPIIEVWAKKIK